MQSKFDRTDFYDFFTRYFVVDFSSSVWVTPYPHPKIIWGKIFEVGVTPPRLRTRWVPCRNTTVNRSYFIKEAFENRFWCPVAVYYRQIDVKRQFYLLVMVAYSHSSWLVVCGITHFSFVSAAAIHGLYGSNQDLQKYNSAVMLIAWNTAKKLFIVIG